MKNLSTMIIMTAFFSTAAFAQDHIKCELKIPDNDVGCFASFLNCPEKVLKESRKEIKLAVHEGEQLTGQIKFNHVVLFPGTKKQDKNHVYLFEGDNKHEQLRDEKNIDLVAYEADHGVDYSVKKEGPFIYISLESPTMKLNYTLQGDTGFRDYLLTPYSAINVSCDKINKQAFEEVDRKQKAIDDFLKTKKEKEDKKAHELEEKKKAMMGVKA